MCLPGALGGQRRGHQISLELGVWVLGILGEQPPRLIAEPSLCPLQGVLRVGPLLCRSPSEANKKIANELNSSSNRSHP